MKNRKYYSNLLRVREEAGAKEIHHAYRQQALLRHPDKQGGSESAKTDFQALHEAYEYLLAHPYATSGSKPPAPPAEPKAAANLPKLNKYYFIGAASFCCLLLSFVAIWNQPETPETEPASSAENELAVPELKPCHYKAVLNGEKITSFSERVAANGACLSFCRAVKERSEGGGVECHWGETVILKEEGESVNLCSLEWSVALQSGSAQQLKWKTKQGCLNECSSLAQAQGSASVQCQWDGILVAEHSPQVHEAVRQPAQVVQEPPQPGTPVANRSIFSILEPRGGLAGKVERSYGLPEAKEIQRAGRKLPAGVEDTVLVGDILVTREKSLLDIRLEDGSLIRLGADTQLRFGFDEKANKFSFLLEKGIVRVLRPMAENGKAMEWFTPEAALRTQSGEFFLTRGADGDVDLHVATGETEFGGAGQAFERSGEFVRVKSAFFSSLKKQKAVPAKPEKFSLAQYLNQLQQPGQPMAAAEEQKSPRIERAKAR